MIMSIDAPKISVLKALTSGFTPVLTIAYIFCGSISNCGPDVKNAHILSSIDIVKLNIYAAITAGSIDGRII